MFVSVLVKNGVLKANDVHERMVFVGGESLQ